MDLHQRSASFEVAHFYNGWMVLPIKPKSPKFNDEQVYKEIRRQKKIFKQIDEFGLYQAQLAAAVL